MQNKFFLLRLKHLNTKFYNYFTNRRCLRPMLYNKQVHYTSIKYLLLLKKSKLKKSFNLISSLLKRLFVINICYRENKIKGDKQMIHLS